MRISTQKECEIPQGAQMVLTYTFHAIIMITQLTALAAKADPARGRVPDCRCGVRQPETRKPNGGESIAAFRLALESVSPKR